jgi:hypothetical protein
MQLPNIIAQLLDASARRRRQLDDFKAKRPGLQGEYLAAIEADDEGAAARVRKSIAKLDEDIAAIETAIEAGERLAREQRQRAERAATAARKQTHEQHVLQLIARAVEFDELVNGQVADMWLDVEQLYEQCRQSAEGAGVDFLSDSRPKPGNLWPRVWMRFSQRLGRPLAAQGAPKSSQIDSIAEYFRVRDAAALPQQAE